MQIKRNIEIFFLSFYYFNEGEKALVKKVRLSMEQNIHIERNKTFLP